MINFPRLYLFFFFQKEYQRVRNFVILNFVNGVELVSLQLSHDFWKIKRKPWDRVISILYILGFIDISMSITDPLI